MLHSDTVKQDSHTHTHTHRGHSLGSVKVQQVCSCCSVSVHFISEPWVTRTQYFHLFSTQSVNLPVTFLQTWCDTLKVFWCRLCMCASVCMWHEARYRILKKSITLIKANVSHDWLKRALCPWTPQWGIYYSNYQRNVLLISHIHLFFPCFDRNAYINTYQQRETGQQKFMLIFMFDSATWNNNNCDPTAVCFGWLWFSVLPLTVQHLQ